MSKPFFAARLKSPEALERTRDIVLSFYLAFIALLPTSVMADLDSRLVLAADSSPMLRAIGKLQIPAQRMFHGRKTHYLDDCSATLVALSGSGNADVIITAWHCLERYQDLSRSILFTSQTASGDLLQREARPLSDGGGMHADWAILRLRPAVPTTQLSAMALLHTTADAGHPVAMAGYSRDRGLSEGDRLLTYDPECAITAQTTEAVDTDCIAFKGASGGAVIQFDANDRPRLCGVISQGNGAGRSTYVPLALFRKTLLQYLR
ncbi:MAG: trypsin-like peptidase domain-containing protein [Halioglobus sp.]|nr:trypsin-like peptidase domain-containing protein [Halioglobus sp.]